jgi:hypothetical protein
MCDEIAFAERKDVEQFKDAIKPALTPNAKFICISTPQGMNHFYDMYTSASKGISSYATFFKDWRCVPGRDEAWAKETIKKECEGDLLLWNQNYLCEFIGSSKTMIEKSTLNRLIANQVREFETIFHPDFKIYERPNKEYTYTIGVDSSKISSDSSKNSDFFALSIVRFDIKNRKMKQVATLKTKDMHYTESSGLINDIGRFYDNALILVENNSEGQGIVDTLAEKYHYPTIYREPHKPSVFGFRTTNKTRAVGLSNLKMLIDGGMFEIVDEETVKELGTFVKTAKRYEADKGFHDDLVFSLVAGIQFLNFVLGRSEVTIWDMLEYDEKKWEDTPILLSNKSSLLDKRRKRELDNLNQLMGNSKTKSIRL